MSNSKRYQCILRELECGHGLVTPDGGKVLEEVFDGISGFEVIDEVFQWHTSASEDHSAALYLGIRRDHLFRRHDARILALPPTQTELRPARESGPGVLV